MVRVILFLVLVACLAAGAAWIADQSGEVVLSWSGWRIALSIPAFALALGAVAIVAILAWSAVRGLWRMPRRLRLRRIAKRQARGRHAVTHGLLAIGHGDSRAARAHAAVAAKHAADDPLTLLLHAQSAQLDGDRVGAERAFRDMAARPDTRLLGLRGLFIEAQRADDPQAAVAIAEEALNGSPSVGWAAQAVLGFRCARGDWTGALAILDKNLAAGLIDREVYRRQRGVLLTARALELEIADRDAARESVMEAVKLAPTLTPAAALAAKFLSESGQVRRAMRVIEAAWVAQPHPDLAEAYARARLGDSARERLARVESLAARTPDDLEAALAVGRAAIDAAEYARARAALAPFVAAPTQRVAMMMAELEGTEHGDAGRARAWTLRALRARHDPAWTADGYVSDRWRPVSPVTGRLDAFKWQTPVAALPSDKADILDVEPVIPTRTPLENTGATVADAQPAELPEAAAPSSAAVDKTVQDTAAQDHAIQDNAPPQPSTPPNQSDAPVALFRSRPDSGRPAPVIPIVRSPDDPGIDEDRSSADLDEYQTTPLRAGGWRGFLSRWIG